jgi:hypothetical protein
MRGQAFSFLSEQGRVQTRQRASIETTFDVSRSNRIDGAFMFESPLIHRYLDHARTCTFSKASGLWRFWKMVVARAWSRFEAVQGGFNRASVTKSGIAQPKKRKRWKRVSTRMVPLA